MPSSDSLRLRAALTHEFEQLATRLHDGDQTAVTEAKERLLGIYCASDAESLAVLFDALVKVLDDMQGEIDAAGWRYVSYPGHRPPNPRLDDEDDDEN